MKITREQFENAVMAGMDAASAGQGARPRYEHSISAALAALGIEVAEKCLNCELLITGASATRVDGSEGFIPCNTCNEYVADVFVWVERTWMDVRQGDIVRPVQSPSRRDDEQHAAIVEAIGPVNHWHASPNASEYRPNESPLEWSAIRVTLKPLAKPGDENGTMGASFTPEHGMRPDAGVEIKVTRAELAAIEALGGWENRMGVMDS